jgi:hypothetical protein
LAVDFVFADREIFHDAEGWLKDNREALIGGELEEER